MSELNVDVDVIAGIHAALGAVADTLGQETRWRQRCSQAIRQVPLAAPWADSAGVIDYPDSLQAKTGYFWSVRRLTLSGFTAGTAVVYINGLNGEPAVPFQQAATYTFGRGELLLHPGDRLVVQATGITGYVQLNGAADCLETWYLPYYLG